MEVTSLNIHRRSANYWVYQFNDEAYTRDAVSYTATGWGDYLTIATRLGAPQIYNAPYSVIKYYDDNDSANNLTNPSSREQLQQHLINEGFYNSGNGGGGGTAQNFTDLLDVYISNYLGRAGQAVVVNDSETGVTTEPITAPKIQDLTNFIGSDNLPPNSTFVTSSFLNLDGFSIGFGTAPLYNLINRPMKYNEEAVFIKGYSGFDGSGNPIWNGEDYIKQIGDICWVWRIPEEPDENGNKVPRLSKAQWLGGNDYDFNIGEEFNDFE